MFMGGLVATAGAIYAILGSSTANRADKPLAGIGVMLGLMAVAAGTVGRMGSLRQPATMPRSGRGRRLRSPGQRQDRTSATTRS
jgi:hypothetical protein